MQLKSAAKVLIKRTSDSKYLILTSSKWEENPLRSQTPDLPGGQIESNESIIAGLQRELTEEIGSSIESSSLQLVFANTYVNDVDNESTTFLLYYAEVDNLEVELSWEHESFEWMTADSVKQLEIREPYPTILAHFEKVGLLV